MCIVTALQETVSRWDGGVEPKDPLIPEYCSNCLEIRRV